MKKLISIIAIIAILLVSLLGLTGCGNNEDEKESKEDSKNIATEDVDDEESVENKNKEQKDESKDKSKDDSTNKDSKPVADLGKKYVDLDKRSFAINGKVYTLGVNTLQEMIDDGVPFEKDDIANANNNINKNYKSQPFKIVLGDYYYARVYVFNDSNENMKIADCKLSEIYLPVDKDIEQDILSFAFPLTVTEEEIIAQAGEPTDKSEYKGDDNYISKTIEYQVDSTKYYGGSGYTFEFVNGDLKYVTIDYVQ